QAWSRAFDREFVRTERSGLEAVWTVVLRDDRSAGFDPRVETGKVRGEISAIVEGAHADHDGIETGEFFRREIGARERDDLIAQLGEALGGAVARAGQVADAPATGLHIEGDEARV